MRVSDLGPLSATARWREEDSLVGHLITALLVGLFCAFAVRLVQGRGTGGFDVVDLGPVLAVGGLYAWYFAPARHATFVGELGALYERRQALSVAARGFMFHTAARVEIGLVRVISDGVHQIYDHTDVTFTWHDDGGAPVFTWTAAVREPDQEDDWSTHVELDPRALEGLPPEHAAVFGYATVRAFEAFQERGPYR